MTDRPFAIDIAHLRSKAKNTSASNIEQVDRAAEELGFVAREPAKRRGRLPSPRTGQIHAKVMPNVSDEIAQEAPRRGVNQVVIIEEAWLLYRRDRGLK